MTELLLRFIILAGLLFLSACVYQNEDDLYGKESLKGCDTLEVSYASDIRPLIDIHCIECHGTYPELGAASFTNHIQLSQYLDLNKKKFIESISHTGYSKLMPDNADKLPECEIRKMIHWIDAGYPNN
ncbi:MAG: hypothetical protein K1X77_07430 [Bacteroidia bacterium]|nr:hypothetical protein [Bacteroidia bacterium]